MSKRWTEQDVLNLGLKTDLGKGKTTSPGSPGVIVPQPGKGKTALEGMQALGRLKSGEMNDTEKKYAARLETLKYAGEIMWWEFEPMNLRLADKCFYKVDFLVMTNTCGLEVHEVKGYWTDDALVKIKVAAQKFPFRFVAVQAKKGEWIEREF